jgi:hypothetical protein
MLIAMLQALLRASRRLLWALPLYPTACLISKFFCSRQSAGLPSSSNQRMRRLYDVVNQTPHAGTVMTAQIETVDFFAFDNSYARLPDRFFARLRPTPVAAPRLVRLNKKLAWHLELDPGKLAAPEGVEILAGNRVPFFSAR